LSASVIVSRSTLTIDATEDPDSVEDSIRRASSIDAQPSIVSRHSAASSSRLVADSRTPYVSVGLGAALAGLPARLALVRHNELQYFAVARLALYGWPH